MNCLRNVRFKSNETNEKADFALEGENSKETAETAKAKLSLAERDRILMAKCKKRLTL